MVLLFVLYGFWSAYFSATKIAFVNYQIVSLGEISKANDNPFIKLYTVETDDVESLGDYDMVFINAMGLRITEAQRAVIQRFAFKGVPIMTIAATNPLNKIVSVDSLQTDSLMKFMGNGGRKNIRSMLNYVRKDIDGKIYSVVEPEAVEPRANEMIYHQDVDNPDNEDLGFNTLGDYERYLDAHNMLIEGAPRIVVTGAMGEPTDLIKELERTGNVVYPVRNFGTFLKEKIDSVKPSAVINMAHGRLGDDVVKYLEKSNIPLFCPLNANRLVEEWEDDKMGMSGGFLSQSVATPEIDGALRPFVIFAHRKDEEGLHHAYTIPDRVETFVETINNYVKLARKANSEKKIAIFYYKGAGQNALTAGGMEVAPSMLNLLRHLQSEGYNVGVLPKDFHELAALVQKQGAVFGTYAEGAQSDFMQTGNPELIGKEDYENWVSKALRPEKYAEVVAANGEFPGTYMTDDDKVGIARLQFGNVVLLPQNAAGAGDNAFKIVHGTDAAPGHAYIASYLWARFGFGADAVIHFGTHGSLEFTPRKQVALSSLDWPDRLVGPMPHFYIYSIANVGEGVIAKRRSFAGLQSYLTPPFLESNVRGMYRELMEKIKIYNDKIASFTSADGTLDASDLAQDEIEKASMNVKKVAVKMGIHRELELDSALDRAYSEDDIVRIENFAEELATEKINGQLYTMGEAYEDVRIASSVYAMSTEPIAYSLLALDKLRGRADEQTLKHKALFTQRYLNPSRDIVTQLLSNPALGTDEFICRIAKITKEDLEKAREIERKRTAPSGMMAMMMSAANSGGNMASAMKDMGSMMSAMGSQSADNQGETTNTPQMPKGHPQMPDFVKEMIKKMSPEEIMALAKKMGMNPEMVKKMMAKNQPQAEQPKQEQKPEFSKEEKAMAAAIVEVERTVKNVGNYRNELKYSPIAELVSMTNALAGGYTSPSPGGDPIANPNTLPTGRNLYGINAEATPSEAAWDKGVRLAENTIEMYRRRHNDSIPRKVSYTLWSGEFIETEGATIAQVLYMLGVEPIRDSFGRVTDLRLIPSKELGRPRIDVVVQTSGQLRDIAASRLFLINRAVEMAAAADDDEFENQVAAGVVEAERTLIEKGLTPKDAREVSTYRVFGAANGGYGTGIQGMVMSGDKWENEQEIAEVYLNNMGAYYGSEKNWEAFRQFAFEAALTRTDAVIQPRQSNTWGALSLDHVYEFMGGLNLAVRNVTGTDPDAYLSDYRNRNNVRMQEVKEAIGVESRTTIFNPTYIKEKMKGDAGSAGTFAEIIQNTYGWNVMKPKAIDNEMWDEIYNVYVKDKFKLDIRNYFEDKNVAALEEITAVMMETARKGMWKATEQQLSDIAKLHTELVEKHNPSCSGFVCDNAKLRDFVASKVDAQSAEKYNNSITQIRQRAAQNDQKGVVMKKEEMNAAAEQTTSNVSSTTVIAVVVVAIVVLAFVVRRRRKKMQE